MAVVDELARLRPRCGEAEAVDDVVEAHLQKLEQVLTGDPAAARGLVDVRPEGPLEHAVHLAHLLLLAKLHAVVGDLGGAARVAVLTGRIVAPLDGALLGVAARAFQKQLFAGTAALTAAGIPADRVGGFRHIPSLPPRPLLSERVYESCFSQRGAHNGSCAPKAESG
jgi:hypothetical protein